VPGIPRDAFIAKRRTHVVYLFVLYYNIFYTKSCIKRKRFCIVPGVPDLHGDATAVPCSSAARRAASTPPMPEGRLAAPFALPCNYTLVEIGSIGEQHVSTEKKKRLNR
jgi:hypothetical protein